MTNTYSKLTKVQLQARLRRRSIPYAGLKSKEELVDRLIEVDVGLQGKEQLDDGPTEADAGPISKEQLVDRSTEVDTDSGSISLNTPSPTAVIPPKGPSNILFTYCSKILSYSVYLLVGIVAIVTIFLSIDFLSSNAARSECLLDCVAGFTNTVGGSEVNGTYYHRYPPKAFSWLAYPDLYKTLGVEHDASSKVIRARRRALVQSWHPDKARHHGVDRESATLITRVINEAGYVLGNDKRRRRYDYTSRFRTKCKGDLCFNS